MDLTEENIVTMIKAVRKYQEEWEKVKEEMVHDPVYRRNIKTFEALFGPYKKKAKERALAVERGDTVDFKQPENFFDKKGNLKPEAKVLTELVYEGFGYEKETGLMRKSWVDSTKTLLDMFAEQADIPLFKKALNLIKQLTKKATWEKYTKQ